MFGEHKIPFELSDENLSIEVEDLKGEYLYRRTVDEDIVEKTILSKRGAQMILSPVEPLNIPLKLTSALLIEFENTLLVEPSSKTKVYVTFPVEVGVFIKGGKSDMPMDCFTLTKPKYTLYGDVKTGTICKYWSSSAETKFPKVNKHLEGVLELQIINSHTDWVELHNVVFTAYGMKIYYNRSLAAMRGRINIKDDHIVSTDFIDKPLIKGMKKAMEVYTRGRQPLMGNRFIMEGDL